MRAHIGCAAWSSGATLRRMSEAGRTAPGETQYYRGLLDLGRCPDPEALLRRSLELLVELTGAREAYIELEDAGARDRWWAARGCDAERVDAIKASISQGIIAEAVATGETVLTAAAFDDPRFEDRESVRQHAIEAVICAPLGEDAPLGVVYLQGPQEDLRVSAVEVQQHVAYFARALAPFAERLVLRADSRRARAGIGAFAGVLYRSEAMHRLVERLALAAPLDVPILFLGGTGVGKSLLARATHAHSGRRASSPFVEINCAAIPDELLENELFGAAPGAHSSVPRGGLVGKVEAAQGGTLFLDEIGELSLRSQAKVLQLLQSRQYYRLGSTESLRADVRLMAATNVDLRRCVDEGRFREDLFYRLRVLEVVVPSLEERAEDLGLLAEHFVSEAAERHDLPVTGLTTGARHAILNAPWPGNVRELAHRLESAVINAHFRAHTAVDIQDVFPEESAVGTFDQTLQEATRQFQKRHLRAALEATNWNVTEAARQLDVARSHLYNLIRAHGLTRHQ